MARAFAIAVSAAFTAFVVAKGVPALRHDWSWPADRLAIPSFVDESIGGWLSVGFGVPNPHPTMYLVALPVSAAMWLFGPLAGLVLLAFATGYCCAKSAFDAAVRWSGSPVAAAGIGLFALFNPWVYNEVVAGHVPMVLAYGGTIGLISEMARGRDASPVRLALWIALIQVQLQFFLVAFLALVAFASATRKWLPVVAAAIIASPSIVGLVVERGPLLQTPYNLAWQANQSVAPAALLGLGGYFAGYADRLGLAAFAAACALFALAIGGALAERGFGLARWSAVFAALLFAVVAGVRGPVAAPYEWLVRHVPESGVFRELYDLAGLIAALLLPAACVAVRRVRPLAYLALAAGIALPLTWLLHPPSELWIAANSFPRPRVDAAPYSRVALLPAFQPLQLRSGGGDGADPDVINYPNHVAALNQYFPTYPVDMALASYERNGNPEPLRALGVGEIVGRLWFVSPSNGGIGLAASSLGIPQALSSQLFTRVLDNPTPLVSQCRGYRIVAVADRLGACDVFFGDAPGYAPVQPVRPDGDSIDARSAWVDARLAFARAPELAQGIGGAVTQSRVAHGVEPGSWILAYVRGRLLGSDARALVTSRGGFSWVWIPTNVNAVRCAGLCALVAQSRAFPALPLSTQPQRTQTLPFREITPFLYVVWGAADSGLLRLNERFDPAWVGLAAWHSLSHVRVDASVNGWILPATFRGGVALVQLGALLQLFAEIIGMVCAVLLLKALVREPTKRVE